jgi:hypothetical protein
MSDKYLSREQVCRWDLMTFIFVVVYYILNTPSCTMLIPASGPVQWLALLYNTWSSLCDMPTTIIFSWFIYLLLTIAGKPIDNIYMHTGHFSLIWVNYDDFGCNRFSHFILCQHPIWLTFLAVLRMTHRPVWWTVTALAFPSTHYFEGRWAWDYFCICLFVTLLPLFHMYCSYQTPRRNPCCY